MGEFSDYFLGFLGRARMGMLELDGLGNKFMW